MFILYCNNIPQYSLLFILHINPKLLNGSLCLLLFQNAYQINIRSVCVPLMLSLYAFKISTKQGYIKKNTEQPQLNPN